MEEKIKVYIRIDKNNNIVEINSEIFIKDFTDWIYIDEGEGDNYSHSQAHYLDKPLINEEGRYNYKYINNKVEEIINE